MVDLGTLPGGTYSEAFAINDAGAIVGWSTNDQSTCTAFDGCWHAVLWENGAIVDLGGLDPRFQSYAYSISNSGRISGTSAIADYPSGNFHAVTWWHAELSALGMPPSATNAFAFGINAAGLAVGAADINGGSVPIVWSRGSIAQLPTPAQSGEARKINERGQIVGRGSDRALLWTDGSLTVLPNPTGSLRSEAYDINNAGVVVGDGFTFSGMVAVRWVNGQPAVLPLPPGWTESNARAINGRGDIAGAAASPRGYRAVVWVRQ
jgi:probable HAF family extracellular repeat protein